MPYCPACRSEYEEGSKKCTDCGGDLAAGTMPEAPSIARASNEKWVSLLRVRREDNAEIIHGLLESADIPCEVIDKMAAQMPLPVSATLSRFEISGSREPRGRGQGAPQRGPGGDCPVSGLRPHVRRRRIDVRVLRRSAALMVPW